MLAKAYKFQEKTRKKNYAESFAQMAGVVKFCSLAHKATPFAAMKKLAPWSAVLMLLQLDTALGNLIGGHDSSYRATPLIRAQRIKSKLLRKVGKTCLPFWHVSSDQTQNPNCLACVGDSTTQLYRGNFKPKKRTSPFD